MKNKNKQREAVFHSEFREDLQYWVKTDRKMALKVFDLIEAVMRSPFAGVGKPELLKHIDSSAQSRQLTQEHRLVYLVKHDKIDFLQARYHY